MKLIQTSVILGAPTKSKPLYQKIYQFSDSVKRDEKKQSTEHRPRRWGYTQSRLKGTPKDGIGFPKSVIDSQKPKGVTAWLICKKKLKNMQVVAMKLIFLLQ